MRRNIPARADGGKRRLGRRSRLAAAPGRRVAALRVAVLAAILAAGPAAAEPRFDLPLDCVPDETCWIMNYPDADPGPGRADYRCGWLSYDGHRGTDFMIRDLAEMARGVAVRAAADGEVFWRRDGMPDTGARAADAARVIDGRDCGNGVALRHADGWTTRYCHMRRGSVVVATGDRVRRGQALGMVGMSGQAPLPHLHFVVRRGARVVDPFVGLDPGRRCAVGPRPLWSARAGAALDYSSVHLFNAGFAVEAPAVDGLKSGRYRAALLPAGAPALVLWVEVLWPRPGDGLSLRIWGPDGEPLLDYRHTYDGRRTPYRMFFAGKRRPGPAWPAGVYTGAITLRRGDAPEGPVEKRIERTVELR